MKDFGARKNLVVLLLTLTTMLGCSALDAKQPAAQQAQQEETANNSSQAALNPRSITFGNVPIGKTQTATATLSNPGVGTLTITHAAVSGQGFALVGPSLPVVLASRQKVSISVSFTPTVGGTNSGTLSLTGSTRIRFIRRHRRGRDERGTPVSVSMPSVTRTFTIPVSGIGIVSGHLSASPAVLALGKVKIGASMTQSVALVNSGGTNVTIKQATITGRGFRMSGLTFPLTLSPGQRKPFSVTFTAQAAGSSIGTVAVTSDSPNSVVNVPVSATAVSSGSGTSNPGNPGTNDPGNSPPGALSTSDSTLTFSNVPVNSTNPLSETLTNTGGSVVNVTQANVAGSGYKVTGLALPLTLNPGQSFTFGVVFAPKAGGSAPGSISVVSDASNPLVTITMTGTATVPGQLAVSPGSLNFGNVTVGQSKSLPASLTASGSSITITAAGMSTSEFSVSGLSLPVTVASGKTVSFTIRFTPQSSGTATANASFASNASNSSLQQSLTGTGAAAPQAQQHSVALSWSPSSTSSVVGYNVYRGVKTGGPYSQITSMNIDTTFTDDTVQGGQTYFYVTTAVDGAGKESAHSNQTQATIPTP